MIKGKMAIVYNETGDSGIYTGDLDKLEIGAERVELSCRIKDRLEKCRQ